MNALRLPLSVLTALAVLFVAELLFFYAQVPETVASHFDANGVPNGWMSKSAYTALMLFVVFVSVIPTAGIALFLPKMKGAVNIPNKEYWLAPERRDETFGRIGASLLWTECGVLAFLIVLTYAVGTMNVEGRATLDWPMIPTLLVFLAFLALVMGRMILRFRTTTHSDTSS